MATTTNFTLRLGERFLPGMDPRRGQFAPKELPRKLLIIQDR